MYLVILSSSVLTALVPLGAVRIDRDFIESLTFSVKDLLSADVQEVHVPVAAGFTFLFFSHRFTSMIALAFLTFRKRSRIQFTTGLSRFA